MFGFFKKRKLEKLKKEFQNLRPELFDESGNTYNGGIFEPSADAVVLKTEDVRLFPDLEFVFNDPSAVEQNHFLPLCSFDLRKINDDWNGYAHFVFHHKGQSDKIESRHFLCEYGDYYITVFKQTGNKINYAGSDEVFNYDDFERDYWERLKQEYTDAKNSNKPSDPSKIISQVKSTPKWIQTDESPIPLKGEKIHFLGQVNVANFINQSEWIFLFYVPEEKKFIQVSQWT